MGGRWAQKLVSYFLAFEVHPERSNDMKKKFSLSERQLGYAMIIPSLILIGIVVLYPIAMSFWNSMFDYRLNTPEKSVRMLSSQVDLERYATDYYYLQKNLEELNSDKSSQWAELIEKNHQKLLNESDIEKQYEYVEKKVANFEPIKEKDEKYASINEDTAEAYKADLKSISGELKAIEGEQSELAKDTAALSASVSDSILKENFVGLGNYSKYLSDARMWKSLSNTMIFTVITVFFELVIGLAIALLINRAFFGRGAVRAVVLIPWAIPTAVSAMMWMFLYDGQSGIIAHLFEELHIISNAGDLLSTGAGAMASVILTDIWKTTPYMALLLLAGLQTIPKDVYEAASVDGASKWYQFRRITLPLLKSSILVALLFRTLDAFRVFDLIFVLTGGGPANSTEVITIYAYKTLFAQQNFGEGSVLSMIVFVSVAIISLIYIKFIGSDLFGDRINGKGEN